MFMQHMRNIRPKKLLIKQKSARITIQYSVASSTSLKQKVFGNSKENIKELTKVRLCEKKEDNLFIIFTLIGHKLLKVTEHFLPPASFCFKKYLII